MLRLEQAEAASDHDGAFTLLAGTLNGVEDELSCAPNEPDNWRSNGRLFPPQTDSAGAPLVNDAGEATAIPYRHNPPHRTILGLNGAIRIENKDTRVIYLDKPGQDGRTVGELT